MATPAAEIARTKLRQLYELATIYRKKFSEPGTADAASLGALRRGARIGVGGVAANVYLAIQA